MVTPEPSETESPTVLPLISDPGNRRLLTDWLEDHDTFQHVKPVEPLSELHFDVCIIDEGGLQSHIDELRHMKRAAAPVLLPYLLLVPEPGLELIEREGGDLVENVLTRQIDEIVTLPIQQAELNWRLDSLLRLRKQSLESYQREQQLRQYQRAVEGSTDMLSAVDREYQFLFANERYRAFHDIPPDQLRSLTLPELLGEDQFKQVKPHIEAVLSGERVQYEMERVAADGTISTLDIRYYPLEDDDETITGAVAAIRDVTEQKERENMLRRTQRAIEASGHAIYITDIDGTIEYVNPAFEEVTGFTEDEAVGNNPRILKSGKMSEEYYERLWETVRSGAVWEEELVNQRKNGDRYHAHQTIAPITSRDDSIEGFVAIQTDITERIEAREDLATFKEIVQRVDDPIMLQDRAGKYRVLNEAVAEYADRPVAELEGCDEYAFMNDRVATEIARQKSHVLEEERAHTYTVEPSFPTKGTRTFRTTRYPYYDEAGDLEGTVAICRDVTDLIERERHLSVLDRVIRHNLRTELTVVQGHADTIAENPLENNKPQADGILEATESLLNVAAKERKIVDVLMDPGSPKPIPLGPVLDTIEERITDAYPGSEIAVSCPDELWVQALAEFEEALHEIVENAVKHSDDPKPNVTVTVTTADKSVQISVADSGPGIPAMEQKILDNRTPKDQLIHGSGLGLWFVKKVVTNSGGKLRFRENEPTGSVVDLLVPIYRSPSKTGE